MPRLPDEAGRLALRLRPPARAVMFQQWRDLLFLHWEFSVAEIQRTLPEGLFVDTFAGKAYLGIVPFFMQNIRPRFLPAVPGLSNFMEMNLRTYVHDRAGVPGVGHRRDDCRLSSRPPRRRVAARTLPRMGELCRRAELHAVAFELLTFT